VINAEDIARPYARAAYEFAKQHNNVACWESALAVLADVTLHPKMHSMLISPEFTQKHVAEGLISITNEALDDHMRNLIMLLAENNRLLFLPQISLQFRNLRESDENILEAEIKTASPLPADILQKLIAALEKKFKAKVVAHTKVENTLLGGVQIHIGDHVIDGSIIGKLQRLAGHLHLKENLCQ
jgi:F-type H+-transporting ATPase subunit delta